MDALTAVRRAVPLVPGDEEDCCARIAARTAVPGRDAGREWLTFLEALELVAESEHGYHRTQGDSDRDVLAGRFLDGVYGAREVFEAAADEPIDTKAAFAALESSVPRWEKHRNPDWRSEWHETTERLLEWGVIFGIFERDGDGRYRVADSHPSGARYISG
jgi:hypothetical protein